MTSAAPGCSLGGRALQLTLTCRFESGNGSQSVGAELLGDELAGGASASAMVSCRTPAWAAGAEVVRVSLALDGRGFEPAGNSPSSHSPPPTLCSPARARRTAASACASSAATSLRHRAALPLRRRRPRRAGDARGPDVDELVCSSPPLDGGRGGGGGTAPPPSASRCRSTRSSTRATRCGGTRCARSPCGPPRQRRDPPAAARASW